LDRPSVFAKTLRGGSVSIVLASILLTATVFAQVSSSPSGQGSNDDMMQHLVQYFMRVGTQQYERGYYVEAEKTFQMAQSYGGTLEPLEQRKLESMLEKAGLAAIERKRVLAALQSAQQLLDEGQAAAGQTQLEAIQDSEFLTQKERDAIAATLRGSATGGGDALARADVTPSEASDAAATSRPGDALERYKNRIANLYYESVKAYHSGDFETAQAGFKEVLRSGLMPGTMAETIRGYMADMERGAAAARSAQPMVLPEEPVVALAGVPTLHPAAATPGAGRPQSERQRVEQLYNRSWELYSQGELEAARQGFVEVAQSGLYAAPEGKRPEDYIATIDRLLANAAPLTAPAAPTVLTAAPANLAAADGEQGGFIAVINRRRNIIRSHTQAVVTDAVNEAQKRMAQGKFDTAREPIDDAYRVVNLNQLHLGDDLYKQYSERLTGVLTDIRDAEAERETQMAEQERLEAIEEQQQLRTQAEVDRQNKIDELMARAKAYWKEQRYEASLGQVESLLAIEPLHDEALTLKQQIEDMIYMRKQIAQEKLHDKQKADVFLKTDEAGIPYAEEIRYPKNWREIVEKPTRQPEGPMGLDPANEQVYLLLEETVDLSMLTPEMPFSEAIDYVRNAASAPVNIVVLWKDLLDNADIEPTTPIDMDGLPDVQLGTALENLLNAVAGGFTQLDYVVNRGVITVATIDSLPAKKMETRVYDITDLVQAPANFQMSPMFMQMLYNWQNFSPNRSLGSTPEGGDGTGTGGTSGTSGGMGGMSGGMGGGMMGGGMMGGGMGGGMMGGMGGGMMGGMGGGMMGGGMMGGMGGGMMGGGGMGGGMGGTGGGMNTNPMMTGIMPTSMPTMPGMGNMMGGMIVQSLRMLIEQSVEPESWYDLSDYGEGTIVGFPSTMPKKLAIYQSPENHRKIEDLLNQLRKSLGHQVSIEARFLVVSENFLEDVGLDVDFSYDLGGKWGLVTVAQDSVSSAAASEASRVPGSLGGIGDAASAVGGYGSVLDDLQVSFLLRATQARTDSKSLAAPKVTVISGESATFTLANEVSYALPPTLTTDTQTSVGAGTTSTGVENNISIELIGSGMMVTPTIMKDKKHVLLTIQATQIDLLGFAHHTVEALVPQTTGATATNQTVDQEVSIPEREVSQIMTRVSVPDNGTLLLGGHKITADQDKEVGVPVLSKIPILGRAFSNRSRMRDHKILLILVKPTVILQEEKEQEALDAMDGDNVGRGDY